MALVSGHLEPTQSQTYIVAASAGQTLIVHLYPPSSGEPEAILVIAGADGSVLVTDHALATTSEVPLPRTQDYLIDVRANPETAVNYSLEVIIPPLPTATPESTQPTRIQFPAGAVSVQVEGHLGPSQSRSYVLRALEGQTLRARFLPLVAEPGAILVIWGADGHILVSENALAVAWEGTLPVTQDYFIDVRANPGTAIDYTLEVTIPPLPSPTPSGTQPTRIQFAPGAISAQVEGHLEPSQTHKYVLRALAGQTMWVLLLPPPVEHPDAIFVISGADGTVLVTDMQFATSWQGTLPSTQDYFITVEANPSIAVNYVLQLIVVTP